MGGSKIKTFLILILFFLFNIKLLQASSQNQNCFFYQSLHHTAAGMKNGYDEGFKKVLKIPYENLGCKHCHVKTCDTCHAIKEKNGWAYSTKKAKNLKTCLKCHTKEGFALMMAKKIGIKDVHFSKGMVCSDCHKGMDVHGTGVLPKSMIEKGVIKANCKNCHKNINKNIKAHIIHKDKVSCEACHVYTSIACVNCHMGAFLKTKRKKGNFIPSASWLLLVNYNGKVTTGTAMTIVYKKHKFICYAPYFAHVVVKKGRNCKDCHNNKAVRIIKQGKAVPVISYKNGKIVFWRGVIPVVKNGLKWTYFDKKHKKWIPLKSREKEQIQWWYAKPLTKEQIKKLMQSF